MYSIISRWQPSRGGCRVWGFGDVVSISSPPQETKLLVLHKAPDMGGFFRKT